MLPDINKVKGIHPGAVLKRALKKDNQKASHLANELNIHKQSLSAIINKKRAITPKLSIQLSQKFGVASDYFMLLQASYDVQQSLDSIQKNSPGLNQFRKELFWDTQFDEIDWQKNKLSIIQRVLERGTKSEIKTIIDFYGREDVKRAVKQIGNSRITAFVENINYFSLQ